MAKIYEFQCIHSCNHHHKQLMGLFHCLSDYLVLPICSQTSSLPELLLTLICFLSLYSFTFSRIAYKLNYKGYNFFRLASSTQNQLTENRPFCCMYQWFVHRTVWYSVEWIYHSLFTHSSIVFPPVKCEGPGGSEVLPAFDILKLNHCVKLYPYFSHFVLK